MEVVGIRCLTMLLETRVRVIVGGCRGFVVEVLPLLVAEVGVDLQNCVLDVFLAVSLLFVQCFRQNHSPLRCLSCFAVLALSLCFRYLFQGLKTLRRRIVTIVVSF